MKSQEELIRSLNWLESFLWMMKNIYEQIIAASRFSAKH